MSKKAIISLTLVFGIIAIILILFWTLFGLSTVTVEFDSTLKNLTVSDQEIVDAGKFRFGASVLFEGKKKYIQNIYENTNENFAYIKISNIETKFPNKFVIHIIEREELFAVEHGEEFLICDHEFRVLRKANSTDGAIRLENLELSGEVNVGDFLEVDQCLTEFYSAMLSNNRDFSQQVGKFEKIRVEDKDLRLWTFGGQEYLISNIEFAFKEKVQLMFAVESAIYEQNLDSSVDVVENENGELTPVDSENEGDKQTLSWREILSQTYVKIDNLPFSPYKDRTEEDIYYCFVKRAAG